MNKKFKRNHLRKEKYQCDAKDIDDIKDKVKDFKEKFQNYYNPLQNELITMEDWLKDFKQYKYYL